MTTVLSPQDVARLVQRVGLPDLLRRLVGYLEADYLRWAEFDKTPRVAAHSPDGVIELMPIAD
ncbi:ornithine cyclodeaminase, partial [Acinetobacter baumannii]